MPPKKRPSSASATKKEKIERPDNEANDSFDKFVDKCLSAPSEYKTYCSINLMTRSKNECMLGIDEAGRGPVLGPMVYAAAIAPIDYDSDLKGYGLADSKTLSEEERENLFSILLKNADQCSACIHAISPVYITEKMLSATKTSLNVISQNAAIAMIQKALDEGVNLKKVFVDTVGPPSVYQEKLSNIFPTLEIKVESKADAKYPIVSAASIFAKVSRDNLLNKWPRSECGNISDEMPLGSGYPGDPVTKKFLETCVDKVFAFPNIVRSSWSTATNLANQLCISVKWEDEAEPAKKDRKRNSYAAGLDQDSDKQCLLSFKSVNMKRKQIFASNVGLKPVTIKA